MDRHSSCRTVLPLLYYLEANGVDPNELVRGLPVDLGYLRGARNWITHELLMRMFARCEEIFDDPLIMYRIGQIAWLSQQGSFSTFAELLLMPDTFIRFTAGMVGFTSTCFRLRGERTGPNQARIQLDWQDRALAHRHGCLFYAGWFVGLPMHAWNTRAWIVEETCVCPQESQAIHRVPSHPRLAGATRFGQSQCSFHLHWEEPALAPHLKLFVESNAALVERVLTALESSELSMQEKELALQHCGVCQNLPAIDTEKVLGQFGLSAREQQIAASVMKGYANHRIAGELFISTETVKKHLNRIFQKTGVKSRGELTAKVYAQA